MKIFPVLPQRQYTVRVLEASSLRHEEPLPEPLSGGEARGLVTECLGKNHVIRQRGRCTNWTPFNTPETHILCIAGTPEG